MPPPDLIGVKDRDESGQPVRSGDAAVAHGLFDTEPQLRDG